MVSLVLTIIAFAGAMGVPAFLTAIVESAASKIQPSSTRTRASHWTDRSCEPQCCSTLAATGLEHLPFAASPLAISPRTKEISAQRVPASVAHLLPQDFGDADVDKAAIKAVTEIMHAPKTCLRVGDAE